LLLAAAIFINGMNEAETRNAQEAQGYMLGMLLL